VPTQPYTRAGSHHKASPRLFTVPSFALRLGEPVKVSRPTLITGIAALALAAGCGSGPGSLPEGSEPAKLDSASFTSRVDNPWMPLAPGSVWVYREGKAVNRVEVLPRTKRVDGISARVVHDVVREKGRLVEDTFDWYAQDRDGDVWYLGEETKEYSGKGPPSTAGSWEAGVKGAQAGVIMPAKPKVGQVYRHEYLKGEAEDNARVLSLDEQTQVPLGHYEPTLMTREETPLEPRLTEYKWYARGIGTVLTVATSGESGREELLSFTRGRG
jgi:hypothetical protein